MFEQAKYYACGKFISRGEWIHPTRSIYTYELIYVLEGTVYIAEEEKKYTLHSNDILILEPELRHYGYKTSSDTSFYWMHWEGERILEKELKYFQLEQPYSLSLFFNQLLHYSVGNVYPERLDYLVRLILAELQESRTKTSDSKIANQIVQWIQMNRDVRIGTKEVAEHFGYNSDYLSRLLKKNFGKSVKQFIDDARMEHIKNQLLNTNCTLHEIAENCGFTDYKYFLKFFQYHEKMPPAKFRNRARSKTPRRPLKQASVSLPSFP